MHVVQLDREYARWAAVVIELSKDDHSLLSKMNFWKQDVYIRPWTGPRHWRQQRKFVKPQERMNSVRRTWVEYRDNQRAGGVYHEIFYEAEVFNRLNSEAKPRKFNLLNTEAS